MSGHPKRQRWKVANLRNNQPDNKLQEETMNTPIPTNQDGSLTYGSVELYRTIYDYAQQQGEFTLDGLRQHVECELLHELSKRDNAVVRRTLASMVNDRDVPILRVEGPRSGKYATTEARGKNLADLKNEQPKATQNNTNRSTVRVGAADASPTLQGGDKLDVLEVKGELALVRCTDGHVYRVLLERVL